MSLDEGLPSQRFGVETYATIAGKSDSKVAAVCELGQ